MLRVWWFFSYLLLPIWLGLVAYRFMTGRDTPDGWKNRLGFAQKPFGKTVWVHATSVGETQTAIPLLQNLLAQELTLYIVLTTVTRTGYNVFKNANLPRTTHAFIPFDYPTWISRFLKTINPTAVIFFESELWPNALYAANQYTQGRLILLNARLSNKSARRWAKFPKILQSLLNQFSLILAQSPTDQNRFTQLGIETQYSGNLKLSRPVPPVDPELKSRWQEKLQGKTILLYASTHKGDEDLAIETHAKLKSKHPNLVTLIIPRHPKRATTIATPANVHCIGELGVLGTFYAAADICIIGNSFGLSLGGGHNPFEAAQHNCPVIFGQDMSNFSDIAVAMLNADAAAQTNAANLTDTIDKLLDDRGKLVNMRSKAAKFVSQQTDALDAITAKVLKYTT